MGKSPGIWRCPKRWDELGQSTRTIKLSQNFLIQLCLQFCAVYSVLNLIHAVEAKLHLHFLASLAISTARLTGRLTPLRLYFLCVRNIHSFKQLINSEGFGKSKKAAIQHPKELTPVHDTLCLLPALGAMTVTAAACKWSFTFKELQTQTTLLQANRQRRILSLTSRQEANHDVLCGASAGSKHTPESCTSSSRIFTVSPLLCTALRRSTMARARLLHVVAHPALTSLLISMNLTSLIDLLERSYTNHRPGCRSMLFASGTMVFTYTKKRSVMKMFIFRIHRYLRWFCARQTTVNTSAFCYGVTRHWKYQHFGLQHAKKNVNSGVCWIAIQKALGYIGAV